MEGKISTTERLWDSCFDAGFARVAGGDFRARPRDRYRQWLTHKFSTWMDQFGSFGCVGCGRCITWCPVRIDVREELRPSPRSSRRSNGRSPSSLSPQARATISIARLASIREETEDTTTLSLTDLDPAFLSGRPGQFVMVALPAFPAVPISISRFRANGIDLTIRAVGPTSTALVNLHPGAKVGVRGPLGTFWPIEDAYGRHAVVVAGGVGLSPLHGLVEALVANRDRFESVSLFYGSRTPEDQLFRDDLAAWSAGKAIDVAVTVDRAGPEWKGRVGVVTTLFDMMSCDCSRITAFVVGPERMMQASVQSLISKGVPPERINVSMERHMECGIGLCGHCQTGRLLRLQGRPGLPPQRARRHLRPGGHLMASTGKAVRPRVAVAKFASCDGCQLTLLDLEEHLLEIVESVRHRRVPRGDVAPLARPVRHRLRGGLHQRPGAPGPDQGSAQAGPGPGHDRSLRHGRRHPGVAQLGRSRRLPRRGLRAPGMDRVAGHGNRGLGPRQGGRRAARLPDRPAASSWSC